MKPLVLTEKKGQLNALTNGIIFLGVAVFAFIMLFIIIIEMRDLDSIAGDVNVNVNNETLSVILNASSGRNFTVARASDLNFGSFAIQDIYSLNSSNGASGGWVKVPTSNYTTNSSGSILVLHIGNYKWNATWNATYSFERASDSFVTVNDSVVGFGAFADFMTIIVLAFIVGMVIAIILGAFGLNLNTLGGRR